MNSRRRRANSATAGRSLGHTLAWLKWFAARRASLAFVAKFAGVLFVLHVLTLTAWFEKSLPYYSHGVACAAKWCTHLLGEASEVTGATLRSASFAVTVARECSGVEFLCLITAVIIAFPASWRARFLGIFVAAGWCVLINVLRVASLLLVGVHAHGAFALVHEQIWTLCLILTSTLFVAAWIHWLAGADVSSANFENGHVAV
jgi:exosortase/archaeosortase family protein